MRHALSTTLALALIALLAACSTPAEQGPPADDTGEVAQASTAEPQSAPASEAGGHHGHHGHHGHKKPLGHTFEEVDKWAKRFNSPERDAWQKPAEVVALMAIEPGMTVADIGAGTGYFEPHLARAVGEGGKVMALDIEQGMVDYLGKTERLEPFPQVKPGKVEVDDPKLPAGGVDRVVVVNTWHHIPDREAYVKKVAAGLAEGGTLTIVDYTMEAEHGPPKEMRLKPEAVIAELESAGLKAEVAKEALPRQYIVIGRK